MQIIQNTSIRNLEKSTDNLQNCLESVRSRLRNSPYISLRSLRCESSREGVISIRGQVPTFFLKQMVQVIARAISNSCRVLEEVEVRWGSAKPR